MKYALLKIPYLFILCYELFYLYLFMVIITSFLLFFVLVLLVEVDLWMCSSRDCRPKCFNQKNDIDLKKIRFLVETFVYKLL